MEFMALLAAIVSFIITASAFVYTFKNGRFTSLFWLALLVIAIGPSLFDVIFGLPSAALSGLNRQHLYFAPSGLSHAVIFAAGYLIVLSITYFGVSKIFRTNHNRYESFNDLISRLLMSKISIYIFLFSFIASSIIAIASRRDLTREFNDFLEGGVTDYYTYFLLASTPIMAILLSQKDKKYRNVAILISIVSVLTAYFIGIRYYMFPFIGYLIWMLFLEDKKNIYVKLTKVIIFSVIVWVSLTLWGVVRGLDLRNDPFQVFTMRQIRVGGNSNSLGGAILLGNEFTTRLSYYDIVGRLMLINRFRGVEAISATLLSPIYPFIMREVGIPLPISNSKIIYDIQSGTQGSGISSGVLLFGNDWFTWGWWGMLIGGVLMGAILYFVDFIHQKKSSLWLLLGPMWTFQLIYFARGGMDVWLGIWGRYLPITLLYILISAILMAKRIPLDTKSMVVTAIYKPVSDQK